MKIALQAIGFTVQTIKSAGRPSPAGRQAGLTPKSFSIKK